MSRAPWYKQWNWPIIAYFVVLLVAAAISRCKAQEINADRAVSVGGHTAMDSIMEQALDVHPDSATIARAWQYDLACSGLSPQPGSALNDVTFVVIPAGTLYVDGRAVYGYHFSNGLTLLDAGFFNDFWLLAHELMHQLLRGPPVDQGGPHPWWPFAFPCELMAGQNTPGGMIMSGGRPPIKR